MPGEVHINLHASVPLSQASSNITIANTSGKAQASATAQKPPTKKLQVRRPSKKTAEDN
jgi:hypothetical protein